MKYLSLYIYNIDNAQIINNINLVKIVSSLFFRFFCQLFWDEENIFLKLNYFIHPKIIKSFDYLIH